MDPLNAILQSGAFWFRPLESLLVALATSLALKASSRSSSPLLRWMVPVWVFLLSVMVHGFAQTHPGWSRWLYRLQHPLVPAFFLLILPALLLHGRPAYRIFLVWPCFLLLGFILHVGTQQQSRPPDGGFVGAPSAPIPLFLGLVSILILLHPFVPLRAFRTSVRLTALILLLGGGFLFRRSPSDWQHAMARRAQLRNDVVAFSETIPALHDPDRLTYIPSAPCRFSADGGYVQGCPMELLQRLFQFDFRTIVRNARNETGLLAIILGAIASVTIALFLAGRWWCGWICPLATLGDGFDLVRRLLRLPHWKPSPRSQRIAWGAGLSFGSFSLLLAAAIPRLDADGRFLGCKIPLYPFCKICPAQQLCPVATRGLTAYPPLPGREWLGGFFLIVAPLLTLFFLVSFAASRRFFCRFCPMGLLATPFNRGGLFSLRKQPRRCNRCGICREVCPMDISTVASEMKTEDVAQPACLYCLKCVEWCPQNDCLRAEFAGRPIARSQWP